ADINGETMNLTHGLYLTFRKEEIHLDIPAIRARAANGTARDTDTIQLHVLLDGRFIDLIDLEGIGGREVDGAVLRQGAEIADLVVDPVQEIARAHAFLLMSILLFLGRFGCWWSACDRVRQRTGRPAIHAPQVW